MPFKGRWSMRPVRGFYSSGQARCVFTRRGGPTSLFLRDVGQRISVVSDNTSAEAIAVGQRSPREIRRLKSGAEMTNAKRRRRVANSPPAGKFLNHKNQKFVNSRWLFGVEPPNKPPLVPVTTPFVDRSLIVCCTSPGDAAGFNCSKSAATPAT